MSDNNEHGHHIIPAKIYAATFAALLVFTVVTVVVSYADLTNYWEFANITVAMFIASIKATLVCAFFMGLKYDRPLNRIVFITSLIFLSFFFMLTYSDTYTRADVLEEKGRPIVELDTK